MERLKPCPFCGGQTIRMRMLDNPCSTFDGKGTFYFACRPCNAVTSIMASSERAAVERWNRRVDKH
ncbi:Lar family restriction alleviation protein [uncultured Parolsenella sp.]|uniref:Lar family restriction alleviation protein n=1 Tax=uncultured Parolsenella sp. TaxID=2083008 RepID=UPI0025CD8D1D|nr:Lar family restriction alleviation protein [uncultured Parolsenella sp.]